MQLLQLGLGFTDIEYFLMSVKLFFNIGDKIKGEKKADHVHMVTQDGDPQSLLRYKYIQHSVEAVT